MESRRFSRAAAVLVLSIFALGGTAVMAAPEVGRDGKPFGSMLDEFSLESSHSNCFTNHGGEGCDDQTCENTVCAIDSFCCDVAWDSICAGEALDLCDIPDGEPDDTRTVRFRVTKDFQDANPLAEVTVRIECNTGTILQQQFDLRDGDLVEFVVEEFEDDPQFFCEITESGASGYTASYVADQQSPDPDSCFYEGGSLIGTTRTCQIVNLLDPVDVTVRKEWLFEEDEIGVKDNAFVKLECENVAFVKVVAQQQEQQQLLINGPQAKWFWKFEPVDGVQSRTAEVFPDYDGSTFCTVSEKVFDSAVETSGCEGIIRVPLGSSGVGCKLTNTVFFEGIPTLNRYGVAVLALLMLGIAFVGMRRLI